MNDIQFQTGLLHEIQEGDEHRKEERYPGSDPDWSMEPESQHWQQPPGNECGSNVACNRRQIHINCGGDGGSDHWSCCTSGDIHTEGEAGVKINAGLAPGILHVLELELDDVPSVGSERSDHDWEILHTTNVMTFFFGGGGGTTENFCVGITHSCVCISFSNKPRSEVLYPNEHPPKMTKICDVSGVYRWHPWPL